MTGLRSHILLAILQLASCGADAFYTNYNLTRPHGREYNPLMRPFVGSPARTASTFAVDAGLNIAVPILLRRRHHETLANEYAIATIAISTGSATFSALHVQPVNRGGEK